MYDMHVINTCMDHMLSISLTGVKKLKCWWHGHESAAEIHFGHLTTLLFSHRHL